MANSDSVIARPENGSLWDHLCFVIFSKDKCKIIDSSPHLRLQKHSWPFRISTMLMKLLDLISKPLARLGFFTEFILNLLANNGGLVSLLFKILQGREITIPKRGTDTFISAIGFLDSRLDLLRTNTNIIQGISKYGLGNKNFSDLCMMASKLAYENENVIRKIVTQQWKMHFVEYFHCWNLYLQYKTTQAFIMCDTMENAKFVVLAFRGTEPFDAMDWRTDVDFSLTKIGNLGRVHVGFLEAMGLADRSFHNILLTKENEEDDIGLSTMGMDLHEEDKMPLAYYAIRDKLSQLLEQNKDAKLIVTGHSLGGALAILFPAILFFHNKEDILQRLCAVYTFGQPRVGDLEFANFINKTFNYPNTKYLRMVYCNDMVPRMPFDDKIFLFKHCGVCLYYNSCYCEKTIQEQPNRNMSMMYVVPHMMNAMWEIIHSLILGLSMGREYREGWFGWLFRMVGLMLPGLSAHCPVNYVNAIRLGPLTFATKLRQVEDPQT